MSTQDNLDLLAKHPGSLEALFAGRCSLHDRDYAGFVLDVAEDSYRERDGVLYATDGESYTAWWDAARREWVDLDVRRPA